MANPDDLEFEDGFEDHGFEYDGVEPGDLSTGGRPTEDPAEPLGELEPKFEAEDEHDLFDPIEAELTGEEDLLEAEAAAEADAPRSSRSNGNGHHSAAEREQAWRRPHRRNRRPKLSGAATTSNPMSDLSVALVRSAELAENPSEAGLLVAALVPLAVQASGQAARALAPVMPVLMQGAAGAARVVYRQPASRLYLRCFPEIVAQTVQRLVQALHSGEPLTPEEAADVLAEITGEVIRKRHRTR